MPKIEISSALVAGFAALSLAGCVTPKPPPPPPPPVVVTPPPVRCDPPREAQDYAARHLLGTQDRLAALNTADLTAEASRPLEGASVEQQMDQALLQAIADKQIDPEDAFGYALDKRPFERYVGMSAGLSAAGPSG